MSPDTDSLAGRLERLIAERGPISVADYMGAANAHYYATRDPFGADGDFITAPEISQMFGELVGLGFADLWQRAGSPKGARYVELGPGRGTLAEDALRSMRAAGLEPPVALVETSPVLRRAQAERVPRACWHDSFDEVGGGPLLIVANEFFDALPVRQLVRTGSGWSERRVGFERGSFFAVDGPSVEVGAIREAPEGTVLETSPDSLSIVRQIARRLVGQGGAALIVDYGHARPGTGDTLQAVARHGFADPWADPGERDLTAHVDFAALAAVALEEGVRVWGPRPQGEWLTALGIHLRAASLAKASPERSQEILDARNRLTAPDQMGSLFKVLALTAPGWPEPAGFA